MDIKDSTTLQRFNFCPGNMGSYDILFGRIPGYVTCPDVPGCTSNDGTGGGYLLVWLSKGGSGGGAFRFDGGAGVCAGYLIEKMGLKPDMVGDANALLGFLRTQGFDTHIDEGGHRWTPDGHYRPQGWVCAFCTTNPLRAPVALNGTDPKTGEPWCTDCDASETAQRIAAAVR